MTDEVQVNDVDVSSVPTENTTGEVASTPVVESQNQQPAEKMLTQSQVNSIAAREARKAEERTRQHYEAQLAQFRAQQGAMGQQPAGAPTQGGQFGGMPQQYLNDPNFVRALNEYAINNMAHQIKERYDSKIKSAVMDDPEFADLYDAMNIEQHGDLVLYADELDNTAPVIKELAKNPSKYANVLMLINSGAKGLARAELKKLSDSIKQNEAAKLQPKAPEPLSQIKPSNLSVSDGEMSVSDFRKKYATKR